MLDGRIIPHDAREEIAAFESRLATVVSALKLVKWMLGPNLRGPSLYSSVANTRSRRTSPSRSRSARHPNPIRR